MTLKNYITQKVLNASLLLAVLAPLFFSPASALAVGNISSTLPKFGDFSHSVQNGKAVMLRGVYVSNVLALPVVQQPLGNAGYVSNNDSEVTQFRMASQFGNVGLLAHNHLSGKSFSQLAVGQEVRLVYDDGRVEYFVVSEILRYQALQPDSPWSSFRNVDDSATLTSGQMFKRVYSGGYHVTFQTCIEAEGSLSWGRLFIIAVPKEEVSIFDKLNQ